MYISKYTYAVATDALIKRTRSCKNAVCVAESCIEERETQIQFLLFYAAPDSSLARPLTTTPLRRVSCRQHDQPI